MNIIKLVVGTVIGIALGFAYYKIIGCSSGTCPITSNPYASSIYGGVMGFLVANIF